MPQKQFTLKPDLINALLPTFTKNLFRYSIAGVATYYIIQALPSLFVYEHTRLVTAIILVVLLFSFLSIKLAIIRLHRTTYTFYDTHVAQETGFITKQRDSIPYKQISKVINNTTLWDRLTNASNITLKSSRHADSHDLTLQSIKEANKIEHEIYKLLKTDAKKNNS